MRKNLLLLTSILMIGYSLTAQGQQTPNFKALTPYTEVLYGLGLCGESNPFTFTAGIQQPLTSKLSLSYDVNFQATAYENYCCAIYSKGRFSAVTPSVKLAWHAGKKSGRGFFIGIGLGYMFAKDRGTEQSYLPDPVTNQMKVGEDLVTGNWDFRSIAPSFTWGVGLKMFHLPVAIVNTNYFAKTTLGWQPVSTGIGFRIGFRKL